MFQPREMVANIWEDGKSIFQYDKEEAARQLRDQERMLDNSGERNLAQIINIMEMKWHRMDRYWF